MYVDMFNVYVQLYVLVLYHLLLSGIGAGSSGLLASSSSFAAGAYCGCLMSWLLGAFRCEVPCWELRDQWELSTSGSRGPDGKRLSKKLLSFGIFMVIGACENLE